MSAHAGSRSGKKGKGRALFSRATGLFSRQRPFEGDPHEEFQRHQTYYTPTATSGLTTPIRISGPAPPSSTQQGQLIAAAVSRIPGNWVPGQAARGIRPPTPVQYSNTGDVPTPGRMLVRTRQADMSAPPAEIPYKLAQSLKPGNWYELIVGLRFKSRQASSVPALCTLAFYHGQEWIASMVHDPRTNDITEQPELRAILIRGLALNMTHYFECRVSHVQERGRLEIRQLYKIPAAYGGSGQPAPSGSR